MGEHRMSAGGKEKKFTSSHSVHEAVGALVGDVGDEVGSYPTVLA